MAENNILKRYLDAGVAFSAMNRVKAEAFVKDLVQAGEVQAEQAQATVADLLERSRKNTEELVEQIRKEITASADSLGLATVADLSRLERMIDQIRPAGSKRAAATRTTPSGTAAKTTTEKTAAKRAAAKKTTGQKTTSKKTTGKKTAAKKATATKAAAKKRAAKKTAAKKTAAKKTSS